MIRRLTGKKILFSAALFCITSIYAQQPLKILPLGNSITYGSREGSTGDPGYFVGYRYKLFQLLNQAGYNFDFIGHHSSGYSVFADANNGGFAGIKDNELATVMQTGIDPRNPTTITPGPYLNYISPDIILLHIGTNDVAGGLWTNPAPIGDILNAVDNYELSSGKSVLVIVAKIISFKSTFGDCNDHANVSDYNFQLTTLVNNRISSGDKLILVDMQCGAGIHYNNDMADDLHPNTSGDDKMGLKWFEVIDNINSAPAVFDIPNQTKPEGQSFSTINLDSYVTDAEDPDADITWTTEPADPQYFTVTINAQRTATITPKNSNWSGSETIWFVATDKGKYGIPRLGKTDKDAVTFTVTPVNNRPVIKSQKNQIFVTEDNTVQINISSVEVEDDDSDPEDLVLIVQNGTNYTHLGNNVIKPAPDLNGQLLVNIVVSDGLAQSLPFQLIVDISPVNDPPIITGQTTIAIQEESQIEILKSFLNVIDVDNTYPSEHSLIVNDGLNYTRTGNVIKPNKDFYGTLTVPLKISDPYEASQLFNFIIQVTNVPDPPQIVLPSNLNAIQGELYYERVIVSDPDNGTINLVALTIPDWLNFSTNPGELYGIPRYNNVGENIIKIRASNNTHTIDTTFVIFVINTNDPPMISSAPLTEADDYEFYYYKMDVSDPEDDPLIFTPLLIPEWTVFNINTGELSGTPKNKHVGNHPVQLKVSDGQQDTIQSFTITVTNRNDTPDIVSVPRLITLKDQSYTYVFKAIDADEDDMLTYICLKKPSWLYFVPSSGILFGTPTENNLGYHEVILSVTDSKVAVSQHFNILVTNESAVNENETSSFQLFPNPADNVLNIEYKGTGHQGLLEIYNLQGIMHHKSVLYFTNGEAKVYLDDIPSGLYFFRFESDNHAKTGKLIINKRL
ncbi:MAG: putative Ig domain-containing protein [Bacteroidales bacterium]